MSNAALTATVALHMGNNPDEARTLTELEEYYQGLMANSPFAPLVAVMENAPRVMELRAQRMARGKAATRLRTMLAATYSYLLDHFGVQSNIRIDTGNTGRVVIYVSRLKSSPNYGVTAYLDKSELDFESWFKSNVEK